MGKATAFVCAIIALGTILIASADSTVKKNSNGNNNQGHRSARAETIPRNNERHDNTEENTQNISTEKPETPQFVTFSTVGKPKAAIGNYTAGPNNSVCSSPPDTEGAITPNLEGNEHAQGTTVTYTCPLGYVSRNSINHVSVCRLNRNTGKAEWTVPEISCIPRSCGDPGHVNNGRRKGNLFTFSNKVEYQCEEGFKLRGLRDRYCQAGGEWSGILPTCEPIYCTVPPDPANGRVRYSDLEYGTELRYECDDGFSLKEQEPRFCAEDGSWSSDEPECIETTCEAPKPPIDGSVRLHGDLRVGSFATYSCDPGKMLRGADKIKCLNTGKWTFDTPQCLGGCTVPSIANGVMGKFETKYTSRRAFEEFVTVLAGKLVNSQEKLFLLCRDGFLPMKNSNFSERNPLDVTCTDGTWSRNLQCMQTTCPGSPPIAKNAVPHFPNRNHGTTIWYKCNNKNDRKVLGHVTCHFGSWIGTTPLCLNNPCNSTDLNYPGLVKPPQDYYESFESVEIQCEVGYRKASRQRSITCARGRWDIKENPCTNDREKDKVLSTTAPLRRTSPATEIQPFVTGNLRNQTSIKNNQECFCTYEYENVFVNVKAGYKSLKVGDTIMNGKTVTLKCWINGDVLSWEKNGLRVFGKADMTCNTCKKWQREDLPTCIKLSGDAFITYEGDLKVLPGGTVSLKIGVSNRFACNSSWGQPFWDYDKKWGLSDETYRISTNSGAVYFISYLNIAEALDVHSGMYECFLLNKNAERVGSTFLHLQVNDGEERISVTEPGVNSSGDETQPNVNVGSSTHPTLDVKINQECFCLYEFQDNFARAQIKEKILKPGDTIKHGETVSIECTVPGTVLVWQNGLRFSQKANITCSTCKKWQKEDLPICTNYETKDAVISFPDDLKISPGGTVAVQKGEILRFACSSRWKQPVWNFRQRNGVSVTKTDLPGIGTTYYVSYLDIEKVEDEHRGTYECFMREKQGQKVGSTTLDLRINESDRRCPPIDRSGIFSVKYSNDRRINSSATFYCKEHGKKVGGCSVVFCLPRATWSGHSPRCVDYVSCTKFPDSPGLQVEYSNDVSVGSYATFKCSSQTGNLNGSYSSLCQENGNWSNPLPSCEYQKCSIHDLTMSIPEDVEPDMIGVTDEYVKFGSQMGLKCRERFVIDGDLKAQCGENGKWKLGSVQCVMGCFLDLDPSSHLIIHPKQQSFRIGDAVLPSCPPGEVMSSKVERMMCLPGGWSDAFPECKDEESKLGD